MIVNNEIAILIVDDFAIIRRIIKRMLNDMGYYNTFEANDGLVAWSMLKRDHFDFVITDWSMPRMEGIDLLRCIRKDQRLQFLPVLMITAEATREHMIMAAQAGVNGYIVKPFVFETFRDKLDKIFQRIEFDKKTTE
jgi:two-component system chemotaxis response regulator CheY